MSIPEKYPNAFCHVEFSSDQELELEVISQGNEAIEKYWTSDMLGQLMFRPFLRWLDKNIVDLLQLHVSFCDSESADGENPSEDLTCVDNNSETEEDVEKSMPLVKSKRGMEMRLLGLSVSQNLGTAYWSALNVVLSCSRCKNHRQVELKEER